MNTLYRYAFQTKLCWSIFIGAASSYHTVSICIVCRDLEAGGFISSLDFPPPAGVKRREGDGVSITTDLVTGVNDVVSDGIDIY